MKYQIFSVVIITFIFFTLTLQSSFADHAEVIIKTGDITSQSCKASDNCFIPSEISIDIGNEVTWINESYITLVLIIEPQNISNTQTIETRQIRSGTSFTMSSDVPGDYFFYSKGQPWAQGIVTFEGETNTEELSYKSQELKSKIKTSETTKIPNWIKNNAGWWANGQIDDSDFIAGIQYMIENGIILI